MNIGYKDGTEYINNDIPFDSPISSHCIYFKRVRPDHPDNVSEREGYFLFLSTDGYYGIQFIFPYWAYTDNKIYFRRKNYYGFTEWVAIIEIDN